MPDIIEFPAGTPESSVRRQRDINLDAGARSSEYTGSTAQGWTLTTLWE